MPDQEEVRVSTLELFFDLVFVFTLTQLTTLLAAELSLAGAGKVVLIFVVLLFMYAAYVWLTNQVPPRRPVRRLLLMVGMAGFLVCALAVPRVFDGGGVALYLAGDVAFRAALRIRPVGYRAAAALVALATVALGVRVAAAAQLVSLVAILAAMLAAEAGQRRAEAAVPSG